MYNKISPDTWANKNIFQGLVILKYLDSPDPRPLGGHPETSPPRSFN